MKIYLRAFILGVLVALLNPVWASRAPIVPIPGYDILEYLQSSGEQYIDTGIVYAKDTRLEQRFCVVNFNGKQMQMGALDTLSANSYHRFHWGVKGQSELQYIVGNGTGLPSNISADSDGWVNLELDAKNAGFSEEGHSTIAIFARNSGGTYTGGSFLVGQTCIWKGGILVRNMVPVRRQVDNVLGLYDYCESKFYENEGEGAFEAGDPMKYLRIAKKLPDLQHPLNQPLEVYCPLPVVKDGEAKMLTKDVDYTVDWEYNTRFGVGACVVSGVGEYEKTLPVTAEFLIVPQARLPVEYQRLFYLESTGTVHYIDTDIHPTSSTRITALVQMTAKNNTQIVGILDTPQWRRFHLTVKYSSGFFMTGGVGSGESQSIGDSSSLKLDLEWNKLMLDAPNQTLSVNDGATYSLGTSGVLPTESKLRIFGRSSNNLDYNIGNPVRIADVEIYEGEEKKHEFIPARRVADGVLGLYDTVEKNFLVNSGSSDGGFVAGPEVEDVVGNGFIVIVR